MGLEKKSQNAVGEFLIIHNYKPVNRICLVKWPFLASFGFFILWNIKICVCIIFTVFQSFRLIHSIVKSLQCTIYSFLSRSIGFLTTSPWCVKSVLLFPLLQRKQDDVLQNPWWYQFSLCMNLENTLCSFTVVCITPPFQAPVVTSAKRTPMQRKHPSLKLVQRLCS